jgi:Fn3-like domain
MFGNILAATAFTLSAGGIVPDTFPPNLSADPAAGATIRFEPESLTVAAQSSGQVVLHFTRPAGLDASLIPVYSGFVAINGTSGDARTLPYAGVDSRLKDAKIMNTAAGFPFLATSIATTVPAANGSVFVLPGNSSVASGTTVFPGIAFSLAMGSRVVRIDVVPENPFGLPRVIGQQILGSLPGLPLLNQPRLAVSFVGWDGRLDGERWAPAGKYKLLLRALKIMGDQTYDHDYEMYSTILFEIKYKG